MGRFARDSPSKNVVCIPSADTNGIKNLKVEPESKQLIFTLFFEGVNPLIFMLFSEISMSAPKNFMALIVARTSSEYITGLIFIDFPDNVPQMIARCK